MKYSLSILIVNNTSSVLDDVETAIPLSSDPSVWSPGYIAPFQFTNEDGDTALRADIQFNDSADRDNVEDVVTAITEVLSGCEDGTKIILIDYTHDVGGECVVTFIYEVVA
ncbi:MAG: hypothetical protein V3T30_02580 [Thermodesulfobacteriota bacterium]